MVVVVIVVHRAGGNVFGDTDVRRLGEIMHYN